MWEGIRNFWCRGRLQTGGNVKNVVIVSLIINVTNAISVSFSWIDFADKDGNYLPLAIGLSLWLLVDYFLYKVSTTDPGLIPRQPDDEHTGKWRLQFKNYLILDGLNGQSAHITKLKYCLACNIMRPRRTVHCKQCDSCVELFDHHCPFISNCVAKRSYVFFWFFLNTLWVDVIFNIWVTSHDIERRRAKLAEEKTDLSEA